MQHVTQSVNFTYCGLHKKFNGQSRTPPHKAIYKYCLSLSMQLADQSGLSIGIASTSATFSSLACISTSCSLDVTLSFCFWSTVPLVIPQQYKGHIDYHWSTIQQLKTITRTSEYVHTSSAKFQLSDIEHIG